MISVLSLLFLFISQASALNPNQTAALDEMIRERKETATKLAQPLRDATVRLDAFEKLMLPVVFTFNRLGPLVVQRNAELDALKIYLDDPTNSINPYDDTGWIEGSRKQTAYVCCDVRRNPRLAQEIQENLAKGLPALSDATAAAVADRARAAGQGSAVVTTNDDRDQNSTVNSSTPPPARAPVPDSRKGMISGLPDLNSPPPLPVPAPVAPPAGSAPVTAPSGAPPSVDPAAAPTNKPPVTP